MGNAFAQSIQTFCKDLIVPGFAVSRLSRRGQFIGSFKVAFRSFIFRRINMPLLHSADQEFLRRMVKADRRKASGSEYGKAFPQRFSCGFLPDFAGKRQIGTVHKTIAVGKLNIRVLSTPGHSEGSVCLLCEDVLISGDTLFADSCGRTDFAGGSMRKMMASLKRLAQLEGNPAVLPGHMETSDLDTERRRNPYVLQALRSNVE